VGLALALLPLLVGRVVAVAHLSAIAAAVGAMAALGVFALLALRPLSFAAAARQADTELGLADRLSTAWELRASAAPLADMQRADALAALAARNLRRELPLGWSRPELGVAGALALLTLALVLIPNAQEALERQRAADTPRVRAAAQAVAEIKREAESAATPLTPQQRQELVRQLAELQKQLAQPQSAAQAQQSLAQTESALRRLQDPLSGDQERTLEALGGALAGNAQTGDLARALQAGDARATQEALRRLGDQLGGLSPEERQRLADALQQAANAARNQPGLAGPLRQAGRGLAGNDLDTAQKALDQFGQAAQTLEGHLQSEAALGRALQELQQARDRLSSDASGGLGSGPPGGEAAQPSDAAGGRAPDAGSGAGPAPGESSQPGTGAPGSAGGLGNGAGSGAGGADGPATRLGGPAGERVFVPGQAGQGATDQKVLPGTAGKAGGSSQPYRAVVGEYAQAARSHLDRSSVPPALKDAVRNYFSQLESQ
jgi:hypothetical protein